LLGSRRLAKQLLTRSPGQSDDQIVVAFRAFVEMLRAGRAQAQEVSIELAQWYHAPHPEPYFLEQLQAEAQGKERKLSGMYYTPWPIVECIVRRVEQLAPTGPLRIVDPACGGGAFLMAAAELAARRPGSSLVGYDLSASSVAVATELLETLSLPVVIRHINPLQAGEQLQDDLAPGSSTSPTLIVLGNPPYANFGRRNRGLWIDTLVADYRSGVQEQKLNLTDDFIKFLRWGQYWIDQIGRGVMAMITSRTYLSGLTHRGMRRSLADSFRQIEIIDLHGDGEAGDANVFSIRRGVSIGVFAKGEQTADMPQHLKYEALRGSRPEKLRSLLQNARPGCRLSVDRPDWLFAPAPSHHAEAAEDYLSWPRLDQVFNEFISGVQTKNDALFVDFDRHSLQVRMKQYLAERGESFDPTLVRPYVVGPFDRRWIYYEPRLLGRSRWQVMRHMVQGEPNVALVFMRQSTSPHAYDHALVVDTLASDRAFYSRRGAPFVAPLWLISEVQRTSNLNEEWIDGIVKKVGIRPGYQSLFAYLYAVLHSPVYRRTYLSYLQRDFPRIPWPGSTEVFVKLAGIGEQLIACHLASNHDKCRPPGCVGRRDLSIARGFPRLNEDILAINGHCGLRLLDSTAATFHVGGHPVLQRWLQVRRGRTLSPSDMRYIAWLHDVAVTTRQLAEKTNQLMAMTE
jgi:predicted RNA methylase